MAGFSIECPAAMHVGIEALGKLRDVVAQDGRRVLLLSGSRWLAASGWKEEIDRLLSGCEVRLQACEPGEPSTDTLAAALKQAAPLSPSLILAVGGGSVLDTAKALSALLRHGGPVSRFLEGVPGCVPVPGPGIPWIAVPTTAGTGAEVTKNAVILSTELGVKRSMRSPHLLARAVIVDPRLTRTLPRRVTGISGLDALTQLVEAYVSRRSNPFVRSLVEGAFGPMVEALGRLASEPENLEMRSHASYGAFVSGLALANAGLGAAHGFAAALGGMFGVPHGLACAVSLPHVLRANAGVIRSALERLTSPVRPARERDAVTWLADTVGDLLSRFELPRDLREYRIPAERVREIAEKSSGSSMSGNPRELDLAEREKILAGML